MGGGEPNAGTRRPSRLIVVRIWAYNKSRPQSFLWMDDVGFQDARQRVMRALRAGDYQHEIRAVVEGKNLLDTGDVTADEVVLLLQRCRGDQYSSEPHRAVSAVPVHIFRPVERRTQWYIKVYFLDADPPDSEAAVFISVHRSDHPYRGRVR